MTPNGFGMQWPYDQHPHMHWIITPLLGLGRERGARALEERLGIKKAPASGDVQRANPDVEAALVSSDND